jgi:hypothetical protein
MYIGVYIWRAAEGAGRLHHRQQLVMQKGTIEAICNMQYNGFLVNGRHGGRERERKRERERERVREGDIFLPKRSAPLGILEPAITLAPIVVERGVVRGVLLDI